MRILRALGPNATATYLGLGKTGILVRTERILTMHLWVYQTTPQFLYRCVVSSSQLITPTASASLGLRRIDKQDSKLTTGTVWNIN